MNILAILVFIAFGTFAFLGGYTLSLWLPAANFAAQQVSFTSSLLVSSWNTTIGAKVESISESAITLMSPTGNNAAITLRLDENVQIKRIVQETGEAGNVRVEDISIENLQKGDSVVVSAVLGNDNILRATRIDKVVNIIP